MTEEDEWCEIIIDLGAETIKNGISTWANSKTLLQLRIDSPYVSENEEDLSNELWIKSIEGIKDPTYVTTGDNATVTALVQDDDAAAVQAVADAQQDVIGWVFPKDNGAVKAEVTENGRHITTYNKTAGLLMYAPFRTKEARMQFRAGDEVIDLDNYTTLSLRLRNYGYAKTLKVTWRNKKGRSASQELTIPANTKEVVECQFNMVGAMNWANSLDTLTFEYTSVGVDNAILFEAIEFLPYQKVEIAGFNFDDRNTFGLVSNEALEVQYNAEDLATKFNVIDAANVIVSKDYTKYTNVGYTQLALNYKQATEGITKVIVSLTVDGVASEYAFEVGVAEKMTEVTLPITASGNITKFEMRFEGTGTIAIQNIRFKTDDPIALDFGASTAYERLKSGPVDWSKTLSYADGMSAACLAPCDGSSPTKYYYGAMYQWNKGGDGNVSLAGKTKVVIVYYNPGTVSALAVTLGLTDMTNPEWKSAITEGGSAGSGGAYHANLETNMAEGEWAVAEIDLALFKNLSDPSLKALTMIGVNHLNGYLEKDNVYIRLITEI